VSAVPTQVRAEGLAERTGDILLQCSGSNPGAVLTGNLSVFLPVAVTNRVNSSGQTTDAAIFADLGSGPVPLPISGQISGSSITFPGLNLTVPASGSFSIRISNIRADVYQLGPTNTQPIHAQLTGPSSITVNQSNVVVANAQPGLLATLYNRGNITCVGSPLPATLTLSNLFAQGTNFASARLTEGFAAAFQVRGPGDDTGTRFLLQYSGFPAGAQLYVPDMVAGSTAAVPTSGGDLGLPQAVGQYVPGSGTLLLVRVPYADSNGAGYPVAAPTGPGPILLNSVSQVTLTNGSGYVVYEVVDANPSLRESAQIPSFIGMPANSAPATANESVMLAPVSQLTTASATAPIPRFFAVTPASDCTSLGDCSASYFPQLSVKAAGPILLTAIAGGAVSSDPGYIPIQNAAGGILHWTATVQYLSGSGWITLDNTSGTNNGSVRVYANPKGLAAGTYTANVIIDAGALAGSVSVPVTLKISAAPGGSGSGTGTGSGTGSGSGTPPSGPSVTVSRIVNSATLNPTPLVAGSLGTAMGSNLSGKSVAVTFDGLAANLIYDGATQINFQVPVGVAGKSSANMTVTVDGVSSAPQTVILAPAWPAIFAGGVLNHDFTANASGSAAKPGSYISIWATGIPDGATVSVQMGDRQNLVPAWAGAAPDVPGVQQVNVAIPDDMAAGTTPLVVCAATGSLTACSPASALVVGQ
jgi:uncharacterized protein (TIGR03437 family)